MPSTREYGEARECLRLANATTDYRARAYYEELARRWIMLARIVENDALNVVSHNRPRHTDAA